MSKEEIKLLQENEELYHEVGMAMAHAKVNLEPPIVWHKLQDNLTLFLIKALDQRTKEIVDSVPMREIMFKPVCGLTNIYYTPTNDIKNWKESIKKKYEKL